MLDMSQIQSQEEESERKRNGCEDKVSKKRCDWLNHESGSGHDIESKDLAGKELLYLHSTKTPE